MARRAVVDATRNASEVPESFAPPFEVDDGVRWVTPTGLTRLGGRPDGFVVIGSGKTGMDTCVWLLEQGVAPEDIRWVRPRDPWMLQRRFFQLDELSSWRWRARRCSWRHWPPRATSTTRTNGSNVTA